MKKLIALILPLMLSACWTGPDFYADAPSVQPIPTGKYKVVRIIADFDRAEDRFGSDRAFPMPLTAMWWLRAAQTAVAMKVHA